MKRWLLVCVPVLMLLASTVKAQEPITIGFLLCFSGRLATFGAIAKQGTQIALDELSGSGRIKGRRVLGLYEDTKGDPKPAADAFIRLVNQDKVDVVVGIMSDEVANRITPLAKQLRVPLIITAAQTHQVTGGKCNRYTFRICPSNAQMAKLAALLAAKTKSTRWTIIGTNDQGSQEYWSLFRKYLMELIPGTSFLEGQLMDLASGKSVDWTQLVGKVVGSGADGILVRLYGGNFIDFIKGGNEEGLFDGKREIVASMASLAEFLALGVSMPEGIWCASPYWFQASRTPVNREFIDKYEAKYRTPPSWQAQYAYAGVKAYAEAVSRAGTTSKEAIINAMPGHTVELPVGRVRIRKADHQAIVHGTAGKTARISTTKRKKSFRSLGSLMLFRSKEIEDPGAGSDCTME